MKTICVFLINAGKPGLLSGLLNQVEQNSRLRKVVALRIMI